MHRNAASSVFRCFMKDTSLYRIVRLYCHYITHKRDWQHGSRISIGFLTIVFFFFIIVISDCIYSVGKKGAEEDSGVFLTQNSGNLTFITSRYI